MREAPKAPGQKSPPEPREFERMTELTRRIVAVRKSELGKPKPTKRKRG